MNGTRHLGFKQTEIYFLVMVLSSNELNYLYFDVQALLIALQEEGLMTPTVVMNCWN
jgi:hypothetical protein